VRVARLYCRLVFPQALGILSPHVPKDMIELAGHILDRKAGHFDAGKFKDEYERAPALQCN
jgi:non-homologous end joining protein Ku